MKQQDLLDAVGTIKAKVPKKTLDQPPAQALDGDKAAEMSTNEPAVGRRTRRTSGRLRQNSDDFFGATCLQEQLAERQAGADDQGGNPAQVTPIAERLMKVEEVATMLCVSVRFVWRLVARGNLKRPVRLGRACRWVYSDVLAYVAQLKGERDRRAR